MDWREDRIGAAARGEIPMLLAETPAGCAPCGWKEVGVMRPGHQRVGGPLRKLIGTKGPRMRMVRRFTGIAPQPWANGRGSTRVLFDDAAAGAWTWRISIADLAGPQPYSSLPGVQRFQLSLGPGDLTLRVNDASAVLHPLQWWGFAGEDRVTATPDAAGLRALNLFARRDRWVGSLSTASDEEIAVTGAGIDVAVALPGDVGGTVHAVAGRPVAPLDSMLLDPGATALEGAFAVLRLVPVR